MRGELLLPGDDGTLPVKVGAAGLPKPPTTRTRWLPKSTMNKAPFSFSDTRPGQFSCAARAGPPSPEYPATPVPATVVIVPEGSTLRIRWLLISEMKMLDEESIAIPVGLDSMAAVAGPPSPE